MDYLTLMHNVYQRYIGFMRSALLVGRPINLNTIGTLEPYRKKAMSYRHPITGVMASAPSRRYVSLTLSKCLKSDLRS